MKAINRLEPQFRAGDPASKDGKRVLFLSRDDAEAKARVGGLTGRLGFFCIDLEPLALGNRPVQLPGGPLPGLNSVNTG